MKKDKLNTDSRVDKLYRKRKNLSCDICPPHRGENATSGGKHGRTKPKYKVKRGKSR